MHMEDLAWQYPVEPVDLAAALFCEAVAKWIGKPELDLSSFAKMRARTNLGLTCENTIFSRATTIPTTKEFPGRPSSAPMYFGVDIFLDLGPGMFPLRR